MRDQCSKCCHRIMKSYDYAERRPDETGKTINRPVSERAQTIHHDASKLIAVRGGNGC
jgi:hypothetical protein